MIIRSRKVWAVPEIMMQDLRANLQQQELMFGPWITVAMLALLESSEVIGLRVAKLAQGGSDAQNELISW